MNSDNKKTMCMLNKLTSLHETPANVKEKMGENGLTLSPDTLLKDLFIPLPQASQIHQHCQSMETNMDTT